MGSTTRGGVSIQNEGSDNCLKSQGQGKVLTEGGDGSCATFTIAGKAFRSEDDTSEGACLDWFIGHGWGLWRCHGGQNQQLVDHGSGKWCSGKKCIVLSGSSANTTTAVTTTAATTTATATTSTVTTTSTTGLTTSTT